MPLGRGQLTVAGPNGFAFTVGLLSANGDNCLIRHTAVAPDEVVTVLKSARTLLPSAVMVVVEPFWMMADAVPSSPGHGSPHRRRVDAGIG